MSYVTIRLAIDADGIATLTLNRPEKHHAMDAAMIGELTHAAAALGELDRVMGALCGEDAE